MTDKEKREFKDGVISIFKMFNILDHTATIGGLRDDILRYIDSLQEEPVSEELDEAKRRIASEYMEEVKKETGYKDYAYWNGLEKGFELGANWQFEKMMKDAVEAEVMIEHRRDGIHCKLIAKSHLVEYAKLNCSDGDKVRVIIIKDE